MLEKDVQKAIMEYLELSGIFCWRNNTGATKYEGKDGKSRWVNYGKTGSSDILGVVSPSGRLLAIEVKSPTGRVSAKQQEFLEEIDRNGGIAIIARSVEDVETALKLENVPLQQTLV